MWIIRSAPNHEMWGARSPRCILRWRDFLFLKAEKMPINRSPEKRMLRLENRDVYHSLIAPGLFSPHLTGSYRVYRMHWNAKREWKEASSLRRGSPKGYAHKLKWRLNPFTPSPSYAQRHACTDTHSQTHTCKKKNAPTLTHSVSHKYTHIY